MDPKGIGNVAPQAGQGRTAENVMDYDAFLLPLEEIGSTFSDLDFLDFYDEAVATEAPPSSSAEFPSLSPNGEIPDFYDPPLVGDDTGQFDGPMARIDPVPFISAQFYSFSKASHSLMTTCLIEGRLPKPEEIKAVSEPSVLEKWSSVWRDRNEETAYVTAWKRIQDKLTIYVGEPPDTPIGRQAPHVG